ncbi:hypothetical protein Tco_0542455 [Tanacetum coccineum]
MEMDLYQSPQIHKVKSRFCLQGVQKRSDKCRIHISIYQGLRVKDKGKGKMVEPKKPLKKKDQIALDEEMAKNLEAQMQTELIEEESAARQKEEEVQYSFD